MALRIRDQHYDIHPPDLGRPAYFPELSCGPPTKEASATIAPRPTTAPPFTVLFAPMVASSPTIAPINGDFSGPLALCVVSPPVPPRSNDYSVPDYAISDESARPYNCFAHYQTRRNETAVPNRAARSDETTTLNFSVTVNDKSGPDDCWPANDCLAFDSCSNSDMYGPYYIERHPPIPSMHDE